MLAERGGADAITIHLREDRRHIQDSDVAPLIRNVHSRINLELAVTREMIDIALAAKPPEILNPLKFAAPLFRGLASCVEKN